MTKKQFLLLFPLLTFFAVALLFAVALRNPDPSKLPSALLGRPVPQVTFEKLEGLDKAGILVQGFSSTDLAQGEVSIINFWSSWCAPCLEEHPLLMQLAKSSGKKVYGVNYKDKPEAALRFLGQHGNPFHALGIDPKGRGAIEWGVYGMPETFIVNGRGEISYKHIGPLTPENFENQFLRALNKAEAQTRQVVRQ